MAQRGRYQGHGIGLVDDKGRVAIPSSLRATLAANAPRADGKGGGSIVIGAHESAKCLIAYDPAYIDVLADDAARRTAESLADGRYDDNIRRRAASGEEVPFDGSGRFVMPDFPRFHADIGEHAFFYGQFEFIEIWNPRVVLDTDGLPDVMKNMVTFYMKQKGIAL